MKLILEYSLDGVARKTWLASDENLRVGKSTKADLVISSDNRMADIHFIIRATNRGWELSALDPRDAPVAVNQTPVSSHVISQGDRLTAGNTLFHVSIDGMPSSAAVPAESETDLAASDEPSPIYFFVNALPSKTFEYQVVCEMASEPTIVATLAESNRLAYGVNKRRLGSPELDPLKLDTADLYEEAPEAIRQVDSLQIVNASDELHSQNGRRELELVLRAARADAACLLFSTLEADALVEAKKLVWAWFVRPSIIRQQLTVGTSHLAEKLMSELSCIAIPHGSAGFSLFVEQTARERVENVLNVLATDA